MKAIRWIRLIGQISLVFLAQLARAEFSTELANATRPLNEGVPEVAVARLQSLLTQDLSEQDWRAVAEKLAEAHIAAKQLQAALDLLTDARLRDSPAAKFWRAQALASLHRWAEALPIYEQLAATGPSALRDDAIFGAGEMLRALGRKDEAVRKFSSLVDSQQWSVRAQLRTVEIHLDADDAASARRLLNDLHPTTGPEKKTRNLLRGRLELVAKRPERAIPIFESLLKKSEAAGYSIATGALFGIADAHLQLKTPEAGAAAFEVYIDGHPSDPNLERIFAKLDELYRAQRRPARAELDHWVRDSAQPRRSLARWYLARLDLRAGRRDRAMHILSDLRRDNLKLLPNAFAAALLEFAQLKMEDRHFEEAISVLEEARRLGPEPALLDRIDFLGAQANYLAQRFDVAAAVFERIGRSPSPISNPALFNASVGWLQLHDHVKFQTDYSELENRGGDDEAPARLRLEEGLLQAARGEKIAAQTLREFIRDFPHSPRVSEAWVALAELAYHDAPPRLDDARKNLARARESNPTAAATERGDYLLIWIEDSAGGNEVKVIELANRFLQLHPRSPFTADVRMKLAETYFRRQDFPNAQTQFEILARENPKGQLTEKALFFAAESAMSSMGANALDRAIVLFDQVVRLNGELKWAARNEQAVIERKLGKAQDAISLYDEVLKSDARPAEKREALCGKADIFFEMGGSENYRRAIDLYDQLASDKDAPPHWRNQALFKKGLCLEKESDRSGALTTFYQVLETEARADRRREFFWFYKAGFNAARLLEDDSKWESAVGIYQQLAAAGGSRSEEAKTRLNRLRLEHFLWSDH